MKVFYWTAGFLFALSIFVILFISSIEFVLYGNEDFFEKEYKKYEVAQSIDITLDNLLNVTDEMMDYLVDKRETLDIVTEVNGIERAFFNTKEEMHMEDVKDLFTMARILRKGAVVTTVLSAAVLIWLKKGWQFIVSRAFQVCAVLLLSIVIGLGMFIATDFNKYFNLFHEIFFTNDLWLLDPKTDLLINIVPEPFFVDVSVRIAAVFCTAVIILTIISFIYTIKEKNGKDNY